MMSVHLATCMNKRLPDFRDVRHTIDIMIVGPNRGPNREPAADRIESATVSYNSTSCSDTLLGFASRKSIL